MSGKVLFVDDQTEFLELLKIRLKDEEYEKFFTSDTSMVWNYLENEEIDVVVSDMNMPQNGIELFKDLRVKYPNIVRIALSGSMNTGSLLMAINEGDVYKYITKPWKVDEAGKDVIRSAISYANYLKYKFYCDCSTEVISLEKLEEILRGTGLSYEIVPREEGTPGDYDLNMKYLLKLK